MKINVRCSPIQNTFRLLLKFIVVWNWEELLTSSDHKLSMQPIMSHEHLVFFRAATSHWMIFSYCLNPESKETWYWDSSNVTEMAMSGVKCTGSEMSLSQCQHHKTVSCQKSAAKFAAGVICSESEWRQTQMFKQAALLTDDLQRNVVLVETSRA